MKQPEDTKTIDMIDQVKRGRGRPPVEKPLTPAERARRYRENRKLSASNAALARSNEQQKKDLADFWKHEWQINDLRAENTRLKEQLEKRDAEPVTENQDALYWEEMYKAEAARAAQLEKRVVPKGKGGQKIFAKIKRSSKYFGQTKPTEIFQVSVEASAAQYVVQGGPGGQYRLADVNLFVVGDDGYALRIA